MYGGIHSRLPVHVPCSGVLLWFDQLWSGTSAHNSVCQDLLTLVLGGRVSKCPLTNERSDVTGR